MNPDNTQNQQSLDPSVVALTKAIGQTESGGNYNSPSGDPGSPPSAYQFTPGFIQNYAPKYLKNYDPNNLTPAQQDELAYNVVKEWGTTGNQAYPGDDKLSPAQIASAWNSGDPNAYLDPEYGKNNKYGSVENYVHAVGQNYEQNLNQLGQQLGQQPQQKGGILDDILGFISGAGSGVPGMPNSDVNKQMGSAIPLATVGAISGLISNNVGQDIISNAPIEGSALGAEIGGPIGAIAGYGLGSLAKNIFGGSNKQQEQMGATQISEPNPSDISALLNLQNQAPQDIKSAQTLSQSLLQSLQATPTGRILAQDPNTISAIETNAKYGFAPDVHDGNMDFSSAMKNSKQAIGNLSNIVASVLEKEGGVANIQEVVQEAKRGVREYTPSNEWAEADKHIEEQAKTYKKNFGDKKGKISLGNLQRMKQETGHGQKFGILDTSAKKNAFKSLSLASRKHIEKNTKNKEFYNAVMKEEQKLINGQKVMKRLNGKKAPIPKETLTHGLIKSGGKLLGGAIGEKIGGPIGAILGYLTTRHIVNAVDKRIGKNIFETKEMRHAMDILHKKSPAMFAAVKLLIKKVEQENTEKGKGKERPFKPTEEMRKKLRQERDVRNPFPLKVA